MVIAMIDNKKFFNNFDDENIYNIRKNMEAQKNKEMPKIYTLVQTNAPCKVIVKESSRKKCVEALLR